MDFNVLSTQNWSRAFNVWIEDIQVVCLPVVTAPFVIRTSLLREARALSRYTAVVLVLLFSLHCTRPQVTPAPAVPVPEAPAPEETNDRLDGRVYTETGRASWYGGEDGFAGRPTANGEIFDPGELTCAHRTLPFGTTLEVKNLETGKKAIVRVNDRGPFIRGRMLDVSEKAALALGMHGNGTAKVRIRTVDGKGRPAPMDPAAAQGDPYTIQVAALADPANVVRLSKELRSAIGPVNLLEAHAKGGATVQRVRVGSYTNLDDARKAAETIAKLFKDRGLEPFITREQ
jgi:rare lipoprotein A